MLSDSLSSFFRMDRDIDQLDFTVEQPEANISLHLPIIAYGRPEMGDRIPRLLKKAPALQGEMKEAFSISRIVSK